MKEARNKNDSLGKYKCEVHRYSGFYIFIIFLTSSHNDKIARRQILSLLTNEIFRTNLKNFKLGG